jgi:hypothetical protein
MSFTVQSKSQLARLMATENLTINHVKAQTASFDPMKRVLYLPIWKDMSGVIYDLLTGHEVGHAQYTPAEGWHSAATDKTKSPNYKGFLNVVEDARIEKKIQRKYPGLRMSFKNAYAELMKRDFFGIADRNVNRMPFIDRLNLYSKSQWTMDISFNRKETELIEKVRIAETWEEVVKVTDEIFAYSKDEQQELKLGDFQVFDPEMNEDGEDGDDVEFEKEEGEDGEEIENADDGSGNGEDEDEQNGEDETDVINRKKMSQDSYEDQGAKIDPVCETDDNYRRNESKLLDEKSKEYKYHAIPKPIMQNIVTSYDIVHKGMTNAFDAQNVSADDMNKAYGEFKKTNERYINLLVKEFEMRKAAKAFNRSRLSDTGEIDVGKLSSYQFDDNIFRKMLLVPKGKSHGLVLLLDKSGSMQDIMGNSIEQILILTMFCRKVNIPFVVYGFGNNIPGFHQDLVNAKRYKTVVEIPPMSKISSFEKKPGEIAFGDVRLREYLSSEMSTSTYNNAVKNMLILKKSYGHSRTRKYHTPTTENLSNTPMTQAVVALATVMNEFKRKNNLDITNLVVVHDGDADWTHSFLSSNGQEIAMHLNLYNHFIVDEKTKFQYHIKRNEDMHIAILEWFKLVTGSKIFSFFLTSERGIKKSIREEVGNEDKVSELFKQFRKENYVDIEKPGYNGFFITSPINLDETDSFDYLAQDAESIRALKTAFTQSNKKRSISRAMVQKFVQGIAA